MMLKINLFVLLDDMKKEGVLLEVGENDILKFWGEASVIQKFLPHLKEFKIELLEILKSTQHQSKVDNAIKDTELAKWQIHDDLFMARELSIFNRGLPLNEAKSIALSLHLRDLNQDDRISCFDCFHLKGNPLRWKCGNWNEAEVSAKEADAWIPVIELLHRCQGFMKIDVINLKNGISHDHQT